MKGNSGKFYNVGAKKDLFKAWALVNLEFSRAFMNALETGKSFRAVLQYDTENNNIEMDFFSTDHQPLPCEDRSIQEC